MDMSTTLTRIKLSLGLMAFTTPFEDLDGTLQTIIQEITLPVFSQYNPVIDTMRIHTKDLEMIDRSEQYKVYLLPDFKTRKLLYVFNVTYDDSCLSGPVWPNVLYCSAGCAVILCIAAVFTDGTVQKECTGKRTADHEHVDETEGDTVCVDQREHWSD